MTTEESDHSYFQAIEEVFVALRGAPLLLSPADWQVARRWHHEGIPLDLVKRTLAEVFEKRKERGAKGKISSLRYCAPSVEAAWEELKELTAPGHRVEAPAFEVPPRLAALAAALPVGLPGRESFAAWIAALGGNPSEVEARLSELDRKMLEAATNGLDDETRAEVDMAVEKTVAAMRVRLPPEELERSRERFAHQALRRRLGLPLLSLFSPEAERQVRTAGAEDERS
ncbi:MAG TPA: hypothetical protein VIW92_10310 [Thermoanaerobaculia bacterium]